MGHFGLLFFSREEERLHLDLTSGPSQLQPGALQRCGCLATASVRERKQVTGPETPPARLHLGGTGSLGQPDEVAAVRRLRERWPRSGGRPRSPRIVESSQ